MRSNAMQGHLHQHHLHQQLVTLLSAALPQTTTNSSDDPTASSSAPDPSTADDAARLAALDSLHRAILYPPNSLLLFHSALLLAQGLSQLLSDRTFAVKRAAAIAYGSLCAVVASNGHQGHALTNGLLDRFFSWALPSLRDVGLVKGSVDLELEGLREFLDVGDAGSISTQVPPILKACQELLEDERTSMGLLQPLLGVLTLISLKFAHCFQPHFVDIVDLLLGWAFAPDFSESDRRIIPDAFLQFRSHWLNNLQFSLGLLSKFLGDMEVVIHDGELGRLLALFSCFSTVLQVIASSVPETHLLKQITDSVEKMASRLMKCMTLFCCKFRGSKWIDESWKCLILVAEILRGKFSDCYSMAIDIFFESLKAVPSCRLHLVLRSNLQLLSLQEHAFLPSSVQTLLQFQSPLSQLRLLPDNLVVAGAAATYLYFLQHVSDGVVSQAINSLVKEMELLRSMLSKIHKYKAVGSHLHKINIGEDINLDTGVDRGVIYSELELLSLLKFDLKMLLGSVSIRSPIQGSAGTMPDQSLGYTIQHERSQRLTSLILEKINPFEFPVCCCIELQTNVIRTLHKLSEIEIMSMFTSPESFLKEFPVVEEDEARRNFESRHQYSVILSRFLRKYSVSIIRALHISSPISVKLEALNWICTFSLVLIMIKKDANLAKYLYQPYGDATIKTDLLISILDGAYDREVKVRSRVASVLEILLQAGLIYHGNFYCVSKVSLDKIGDPDSSVKDAFVRMLSISLPLTIYTYGLTDSGCCSIERTRMYSKLNLEWKQVLAFKQLPQKLRSQQLVSVLSYIAQRSKMPLSSWIQRFVFICCSKNDSSSCQMENGVAVANYVGQNAHSGLAILDRVCSVNDIASIWWSIHEAARHCVTLRLRTNLGGPTQTFAALEHILLDIPNIMLLDIEQTEGNFGISSSSIHLLPTWLLLEFIEALKKNVYNAYEGSSVLPSPTQQSCLFFRANKKVCEEWFSRMCEPVMNAALALHCHDAAFHYCALKLQDLRNLVASTTRDKAGGAPASENIHNLHTKLAGDVLKVLRHAALALCRSHEAEALAGLQKWVVMAFPSLFMEENSAFPEVNGSVGHFSWMTGLIYQAQGQYEKAAALFSHLLQSEDSLGSMGADGIQFIIARVIESYSSLSDWRSLNVWLAELQTLRAMHAGKVYSGALTAAGTDINAIHALACFDEGDIQATWGYLDLTPKSSSKLTLDPRIALERSEQMLLRSMLQMNDNPDKVLVQVEKAKLMLDEALSVAPLNGLTEAAACAAQLHCIFAFECNYRCNDQEGARQLQPFVDSLYQNLHSPMSTIHQDCSLWIKIFRIYRTLLPSSLMTLLLCHKLHSLGRKQRNFLLADRMSQYFKEHLRTCSVGKNTEMLVLNFQYDNILLKYAEGKQEEALISMWSLVRSDLLPTTTFASEPSQFLKAKACLKLSAWLRQEYLDEKLRRVLLMMHRDFNESNAQMGTLFTTAVFSSADIDPNSDPNLNAIREEIIGTAIKSSCHLCSTMSKAWLSYASWCFSQASGSHPGLGAILQSCSLSPILQSEISTNRFQLTEEEMSQVRVIIKKICHCNRDVKVTSELDEDQLGRISAHSENEAIVNSLVEQVVGMFQAAAGVPGFETLDVDRLSATLSTQLQMLFSNMHFDEKNTISSSTAELVEIWWSLRQRRVSLFGCAAHGYFKYLSSSFSGHQEIYQARCQLDVGKEKTKKSCILRAMLYILHILLNYGVELSATFEHGFASVPLLIWQEITPQLFARLSSHPKQAIRKQVEGLLLMLAKLSPWSIVYPTLVDKNAYEGGHFEELQRLYGCLNKLHPKLVQDVQLVINELGMITVLWEELWLSTLQDLHSDVMRRISLLKDEALRIAGNSTLSSGEKNKINAAKYSAMMAPIVVALERRLASTSCEPKTDHEIWFQKEYGEQLKSAILAFKTPPGSGASIGDVWRPFDVIATSLASYQRKSSLSLSEVAPHLALLSASEVPMPGLEKQNSEFHSESSGIGTMGIITISSFSDKLTILPTKTKPKKLVLQGSDGQNYTYLLKGREDLRLDARIMQLLQAVNSFLQSCTDTRSRSLAVRYYTVTPISGRAGLIQWVDNVTSIYSVFKSWQNRVQLAQLLAIGGGNAIDPLPPVPRPSDMFYGKIIPALKEKGLRRVISRRDWPHEVKRKVLLELMQETPRQLLWQEMWCASEGFKAFSSKSKRFSGSVAAMSMLGYILGLGDRHLDNILLDFCNGDVIHIDYNVCFDKGKRLNVPEIVPFRLTQTIEAALGLTGTEGTFRANCEAVTGVLRKNKDLILMLLEVFVWDPLVEWTRGDNHDEAVIGGEEKKGMELAVSLSLFASRLQEIRVPLQEHHDLLLATLPAVESALKRFLDVLNQYEVISSIYYHVDKERSVLLQREISAKSTATAAKSISEKTRASFESKAHEFAQIKGVAAEKSQEAAIWLNQHGRVLDALRNGSIPDVQACLRLCNSEEALHLTSAVLAAGVPLAVVPEPTQAQCYELDREVLHLLTELCTGTSSAVVALNEYALALQRVLPPNYLTTSPVSGLTQILQLSVSNLSSDTLSLAKRQAADLIAKAKGDVYDSTKQKHRDLLLTMERYIMEIDKVNDECAELINSVGSDGERKSKDHFLSTFTKYMQSAGYSMNEGAAIAKEKQYDATKDFKLYENLEDNKSKVLSLVLIAVNELYKGVRGKLFSFMNNPSGKISWVPGDGRVLHHSFTSCNEFEEHIEKCVLLADFVSEVQALVCLDSTADNTEFISERNWASPFQACLYSCKKMIEEIVELILPEIISAVVSCNSDIMEAFGSLSQIRGSIDTAVEQLIEVDLERASLLDLEKNYFVKVGFITEQQLALEEAAAKGRDHLSWEEAEELASQEEACRAKLDQLQQTWNEKDSRSSSLSKIEAKIISSLISTEQIFSTLISTEQDADLQIRRSRALLAAFVKPFSELESADHFLSSYVSLPPRLDRSCGIADILTSGTVISEVAWRFASLLRTHSFFIWKVGILDSIIDLCLHNVSSSVDQNLGFDQLFNMLKKKLEIHMQNHVGRYLKERLAPVLIVQLDKLNEHLWQTIGADLSTQDAGTVRTVQFMLEEYCNAHETARAAKSAISQMKRQVNELTEALHKTVLEIVQLEWLHDLSLPHLQRPKASFQCILGDDRFSPVILNLSRPKLLEKLRSAMTSLARSTECLQSCEITSVSAEGQLERAIGWACAGPSCGGTGNVSIKNQGIPSEFHDHLVRRKQIMWAIREHVSDIVNICSSVLEFESSRDGIFHMSTEKPSGQTTGDGRSWQQAYLNILTRLDVSYHSFTCAEQEWKLAQNNMEAAAISLFSATKELTVASVKAKSASGDLQEILAAIHDCAYESSAALSSFGSVFRGHTALTSECGSMLEEVLAITESLHDLYGLGKEAARVHNSLMADLAKANMILLPLEASLSTDVVAMADAISKEKENNSDIPPIHGQAVYKSYCFRLRDACQSLEVVVPSLSNSVKELYSMLTNLGRASSLHAGNLHKALEGLGESQFVRSQELALSRSEFSAAGNLFGDEVILFADDGRNNQDFASREFSLQDEGWISPPEHTYSSSFDIETTSTEANLSEYPDAEERLDCNNTRVDISIRVSFTDASGPGGKSKLGLAGEDNVSSSATETQADLRGSMEALTLSSESTVVANTSSGTGMPADSNKRAQVLPSLIETGVPNIHYKHDMQEVSKVEDYLSCKTGQCSLNLVKEQGKNAYALSALRQVELKLEGRESNEIRSLTVSEQVDHLLKQAMSIDNLCNMYEGWTPWI